MSGRYDDIIDLPHHQSAKHPRMTMEERAAQFSPFAALTGYGAVIAETGRLTEKKIELDEEAAAELDRVLRRLLARDDPPAVVLTVFLPDERKEGGRYAKISGIPREADPLTGTLLFTDGRRIPLDDILRIEEREDE